MSGISAEIQAMIPAIMVDAQREARRAWNSAPHALELGEMVSLAYYGLTMAAARWEEYCATHRYSPAALEFFRAYALRRIRGAMLDAMRSSDWVTRSTRGNVKQLRAAGQDQGATEEELAQRTGLTPSQIRSTAAQVAARPVSIDAEPAEVPDPDDVESSVVVGSLLSSVVGACQGLSPEVQVVLALHYHQGWDLKEIAVALVRSEAEVSRLHTEGCLAVHQTLLRSVTA